MNAFEGFTKGVNLGGWLSQCVSMDKEHFDTFITEADIAQIAGWGLDHVRLPIDYFIIEKEDGSFREDGFAYVENCIKWCEKHGLHIILDLHKTFGYTFDPLDHGDLEAFFYDKALQARFINTWCEFARRFGEYHEFVAFELLNEIVSPKVIDAWNEIVKEAVAAIRGIAPETYVVFGGVNYNNVTSVPTLIEPFTDKLVYNFHCYEPLIFTHQKAYWVEGMTPDFEIQYPATIEEYREASKIIKQESLMGAVKNDALTDGKNVFETLFMPAIETANSRNVPLYCGEYGVIDQAPLPDTLRWFEDIHAVFEKHHIGRAVWNYKNKDFGLVDDHYADIRKDLIKNL